MRALPYILAIVAIVVALAWLAWRIYKHRAAIRQNDPYSGLSRKKRQELAERKAELEVERQEQNERERVRKFIDPYHPDSDVWKDLK